MSTFNELKELYRNELRIYFDDPIFEQLVNTRNFEKVYDSLSDRPEAGVFTRTMLEAGENPLKYLHYVPAFYLYPGLCTERTFTIPEQVEWIGESAFSYNENLESVVIASYKLHTIGFRAFEGCLRLQSFHLPVSVKKLCDEIFASCPCLKEIKYEGTVRQFNEKFNGVSAWRRHSFVKKVVCSDGNIIF